jgi:pentalenene oxygenase
VHPAAQAHDVDGETIPAGTPLLVSPWVLHRDGRFWPEPQSFDPDRWLGERGDAIAPGSFVAFSAGPRRCPARPFGELLLTLVVAAVARRWRLRPTTTSVKLTYVPFLQPKGGLAVELVERRVA